MHNCTGLECFLLLSAFLCLVKSMKYSKLVWTFLHCCFYLLLFDVSDVNYVCLFLTVNFM